MQENQQHSHSDYLCDIDTMARALFTWVRQQSMEQRFLGFPVTAAEEYELAAGFLAGLKVRLGLAFEESMLVAYGYTLMRGERNNALAAARNLLNRETSVSISCAGYLHGLEAARRVLGEHSSRETARDTRIMNNTPFN